MRILFLTQYYPPEVGAPQNRLHGLARHLLSLGAEVEVLTAMPNYPQMKVYDAYRGKKYVHEVIEGITVHRSAIYTSSSRSVIARLRNYFSFVWSAAMTGKRIPGAFDFLLCESPPLFLGYSALYLKRKKKCRLIFNVSDLWPESAEKLDVVTNRFLLARAYALEAKLYRKAALVTGQTQGICSNISARFPSVPVYWLPNGADLEVFDPALPQPPALEAAGVPAVQYTFLYAGIIGLAQGLDVILRCASFFNHRADCCFVLMGDGPDKDRLHQLAQELGLHNVHFVDPVPRSKIPAVLKGCYATIIPLKKLDIFKGAIPSKIFESLAMEVPVLLGVDGEARRLFIDEGRCGMYFEPENDAALVKSVQTLIGDNSLRNELGRNGRSYALKNFDRRVIASGFFDRLRELLSSPGRGSNP